MQEFSKVYLNDACSTCFLEFSHLYFRWLQIWPCICVIYVICVCNLRKANLRIKLWAFRKSESLKTILCNPFQNCQYLLYHITTKAFNDHQKKRQTNEQTGGCTDLPRLSWGWANGGTDFPRRPKPQCWPTTRMMGSGQAEPAPHESERFGSDGIWVYWSAQTQTQRKRQSRVCVIIRPW